MKFSCTKENLYQALSLSSSIAGKNANLPILANALIRVAGQKVEICATNLELAAVVSVRSKAEEEGSFTAPARTLTEFVGLMPEEKIDVELKDNELSIVCGKSSTKIKGIAAEDFPVIPAVSGGSGFLINAEDLEAGLLQVFPAAARTDIRPELAGLLMDFNADKGKLILAATDSYRLAEKKITLRQGEERVRIILPGRAAQEVIRAISSLKNETEKEARILVNDGQFVLNFGNVQMISRLTEGQYPDYAQIIPKEFKTTAILAVPPLVKEIKAASLFASTGTNSISVDINASRGMVGVSSTSSQMGEYSSESAAEIEGEENSILLNYRYLLDGLANINSAEVLFKVIGPENPCLLAPKGDDSFLYIVMPIRQ